MSEPKWVVKKATPRQDYSIELEFADGTQGTYDARPLLEKKIYQPLNALPFFMMAHVEFDTVVWNDEIDIAPERLYEDCVPVESFDYTEWRRDGLVDDGEFHAKTLEYAKTHPSW